MKHRTQSLGAAIVALSVLLFGPGGQAAAQDSKGRPAQFKSEVDQVVLYAVVYDAQGAPLSGLQKDDFEIYEDRVLQTIDYFSVGDIPSSIGLVLDISGSMKSKMFDVEEAAKLFLDANNENNELFLMSFNSEAQLEEPFTRDVIDIQEGVENLIPSGGTAFYDAVYLAVGHAASKGTEPRKAVIVFTDGEDKDSYYTLDEVVEEIQEQEVQVYIVAFLDETLSDDGGFFGAFKSQREKVQEEISRIAEATGGKAIFPEKQEELAESFQVISRELQNQYQFGYLSTNPKRDGAWRTLRVKLKDDSQGRKVRAKKGYFARKPESAKRD